MESDKEYPACTALEVCYRCGLTTCRDGGEVSVDDCLKCIKEGGGDVPEVAHAD